MNILFDIGASKTRIAFSARNDSFEEPRVLPTSENYNEGLRSFLEIADKLANGREIKKVVGGMSRSIPNWTYEKFKNNVGNALKTDVLVENDSAMVGLGEANFGAGRGFEIMAYVTVSTGVGGARIVNGKIDGYAIGFEPGKQIIDAATGKTLEDMISGRALAAETGMHPTEVTDPMIWQKRAKFLAIGLNNIIVEWSPHCVVIGGSMITGRPAIPLDETENYLKEILKIFPSIPVIKKAELGDFGGLWGALTFL